MQGRECLSLLFSEAINRQRECSVMCIRFPTMWLSAFMCHGSRFMSLAMKPRRMFMAWFLHVSAY